jgi:23S rRNA-/tRNA-specific pseudouridylate synthase
MSFQVIYEDNHLLAVNKPAGVLVQGDQTGDNTSRFDTTSLEMYFWDAYIGWTDQLVG